MICLIKDNFYYMHYDWFDGSVRKFSVAHALGIFENHKINEIKNNKCKVVLDKI